MLSYNQIDAVWFDVHSRKFLLIIHEDDHHSDRKTRQSTYSLDWLTYGADNAKVDGSTMSWTKYLFLRSPTSLLISMSLFSGGALFNGEQSQAAAK